MRHIRAILLNKWFLLNYLLSLLVTLPIPMLHVTVNDRVAARFSVYHCYRHLFQGEYSKWTLLAIGLHLAICFVVTLGVWAVVVRPKRASEAGSAEPENAPQAETEATGEEGRAD